MSAAANGRHEVVRQANVEALFAAIAELAPVSRSTLVDRTGLSKPTVLRLVEALEREGLVRRTAAPAPPRTGRIPARYEPDPTAAHVIGVDVGGTKIALALAALTGPLLAEAEVATAAHDPEVLLSQVTELSRELARDAGVPWSDVGAITVGMPGVESPAGAIELAGNLPGLGSLPVAARLTSALGVPVEIENDVNLATLGELEAGVARSCRTFALLSVGTGIGLGLVINGQLARGARGAAGEVAWLPIGADPASAEARRRGAFEVAASGTGVTAMLAEELLTDDLAAGRPPHATTSRRPRRRLTPSSSAQEVYQAAAAGEPAARRVVGRHAELVARAILSISCLVDPELVVLGGGIGADPTLLGPVTAATRRIVPWPVRVETSGLGPAAGVIGAVHHARRAVPRLAAARVSARSQRLGLEAAPPA